MANPASWLWKARLGGGVVLFAYVATHLLNHALGIVSLEAMEAGQRLFLSLWRTSLGTVVLYGALAVHLVLVLYSLYRRRTLRMPWPEAVRTALGLAVVPLLALHVMGTRGLHEVFELNDRYAYVLAVVYVYDPTEGLKQAAAIVAAWAHGSMGVHFRLRRKPWYPRLAPHLYALAVLWPALALAGFLSAGHEVELWLQSPAWTAAMQASVKWPAGEALVWVYGARDWVLWSAGALVVVLVAAHLARLLVERHRGTSP